MDRGDRRCKNIGRRSARNKQRGVEEQGDFGTNLWGTIANTKRENICKVGKRRRGAKKNRGGNGGDGPTTKSQLQRQKRALPRFTMKGGPLVGEKSTYNLT